MKKYILSPCGTSLLTNKANQDERKLVFKYANKKQADEIPSDDKQKLQNLIDRALCSLKEASNEDAKKMSAELNGIINIYGGQITNDNKGDYHFLLSTDTWLGERTANLVKGWLEKHYGLIIIVHRQVDLQTQEISAFQLSLSELIKKLSEEIPEYSKKQYKIIFNLTGGFKSVQGFLQSISNFYADETVYIFETSSQLLTIPKLPVRMDVLAEVKDNVLLFRQLSLGIQVDAHLLVKIPETLLFSIENQTMLSPWGELIWEQSKADVYKNKLLSSPTDKIQYSEHFKKDVLNVENDRIFIINKQIDKLYNFLEKGQNPRSLDFKQLQGTEMLLSTHELDAWSDKDAKRIFGHYSGKIFVLDSLSKGLH